MNRRTALKLACAFVVTPGKTSPKELGKVPQPTDGETWDSLAEGMAQWERSANRDNFGPEWRTIRERAWIAWNHRRNVVKPDAVSLVFLSSPGQNAGREMLDALGLLADAGNQTLGIAVTNCNHVAAAFVWADHLQVERLLGGWRIERPEAPCELMAER